MTGVRGVIAAVALLPAATGAAELRDIVVDYDGETYTVNSEVWFDASQRAIYAVFSDWDLSEQFSSAIVEARNIGPDADGRRGFYVKNRGCILFFCKSVERSGSVSATPDTELVAEADPDASDFRRSDERWSFRSDDGGTLVEYSLRMQPAFWVPPLIGPYVIKKKLREDGAEALERIERLAREWDGRNG